MLKMVTRIAGFLVVLGLLMVPATVLAAPSVTATPAAVPPGASTVFAGSGFPANSALGLVVEFAPGQGERYKLAEVKTAADGTFQYKFTTSPVAEPKTVNILVVSMPDMTELARTQLTILNAPPARPERMTISPASGPVGTQFTVTGTGFAPGARVMYGLDKASGPPEIIGNAQAGADGRFTATLDSRGYALGSYRLLAATDPAEGAIAAASFTVTAAATPGLPNTGGGGMTSWMVPSGALVAGLGLVVLAAVAIGIARRRTA